MRRVLAAGATAGMWLFRFNVGKAWQGIRIEYLGRQRVPQGWVLLKDARVFHAGPPPGFSDLAGWTEYTIRPADVGRTVAVFTALETKTVRGTVRPEQEKFIAAVRRSGGIAQVLRADIEITETLAALAAEGGRTNG